MNLDPLTIATLLIWIIPILVLIGFLKTILSKISGRKPKQEN